MDSDFTEQESWSSEDEKFDQIYAAKIRKLSPFQWTPVRVAAEAAKLLVTAPGTRVLDIGCGPGKFCLVGASLTDGHFVGIEQRADLAAAARVAASALRLTNVEIVQGNVTNFAFANYDAFYLFNPFEENMDRGYRIDSAVPLSPMLFKKYNNHVAAQLGSMPIGTRVVTYAGYADEIPACYDCASTLFQDELKLWIKQGAFDPAIEALGLGPSRSYRGPSGWAPPRARP
ncbi:MAG: methyltransferase domain-containing protein [Chthoniobacterales bacterium]